MIEVPALNVLDDVAEFLSTEPTDDALLEYKFSDELQERIHYLLERNGEGELTFYEERELEDFIRANRMMSLLKVKTRLRLRGIDA